jgi:DNA-binding CsgD family transcriptional regulator
MASNVHRTEDAMQRIAGAPAHTNGRVASHLADALRTTLDSLAAGVVIVADKAEILHANAAASRMLAVRSPILSLGGCLAALQADATRELRTAIAASGSDGSSIGPGGVGVPLVDKDMNAATAHVMPLGHGRSPAPASGAIAAVFVTRVETALPVDVGVAARIFRFTPAETRLLKHLMAGASLTEAAAALGVSVATVKTHRNHIFMKAGVSRRTELMALIGRLLPPIRRPQDL